MSLQCICEKCGGTVPASLALFRANGFTPGFLRQKSVKNGKPVLVFVDNGEIADDFSTTAQVITSAKVGKVVSWNERVYDDEEDFIDDYRALAPEPDAMGYPTEEQTIARARELWKKHGVECIVCYSHASKMPKECEVAR